MLFAITSAREAVAAKSILLKCPPGGDGRLCRCQWGLRAGLQGQKA